MFCKSKNLLNGIYFLLLFVCILVSVPYCDSMFPYTRHRKFTMLHWVYDRWPLDNSPLGQLSAKILKLERGNSKMSMHLYGRRVLIAASCQSGKLSGGQLSCTVAYLIFNMLHSGHFKLNMLHSHCHHNLLTSQMNLFILYRVFAFYTVTMNTDFRNI